MVVVMGLLFANRMHVLLLAGVLAASGALLPGCGLFGDIPEFGGTDSHLEPISDAGADSQSAPDTLTQRECTAPADCPALANMSATCAEHRCVYTCEQGFVDVDGSIATNGCECASSAEVCDGEDNDCDGFVDNLFGQGQIAVGGAHTCATDASGDVYCWGANDHGQLGVGSTQAHAQPTRLPAPAQLQVDQISAGESHTCALNTATASLWCWGANDYGQLGDATPEMHLSPVEVIRPAAPLLAAAVAAGGRHTCAIDTANQLYCWGDNRAGQLGGEVGVAFVDSPSLVFASMTFDAVAAGAQHTCGLSQDGLIYCWGDNARGQLGAGDFAVHSGALQPAGLPATGSFSAIAAGGSLTCALHSEGSVFCWGGDTSGAKQMKDGQGMPIDFSGASLSVGSSANFCALNAQDGTLRCGGINEGSPTNQHGSYGFSTIAAGSGHTCAINPHGRVYCWGDNSAGQIGSGIPGGRVPAPLVATCQ